MAEVSLDQLYFGKDDAESDITKGGLLRVGFLRTRAYEEAGTVIVSTSPFAIRNFRNAGTSAPPSSSLDVA